MKAFLLFILIGFASAGSAQHWQRITFNWQSKTGIELNRFRETYQMVYFDKRLGLKNRPYSNYAALGLGYNFVISENFIRNPSFLYTRLDFDEAINNSLSFSSSFYYSRTGSLEAPIILNIGYTPSQSFGDQVNLSIGFSATRFTKFLNHYFEEGWKNRQAFVSLSPCLTIQNGLYWGLKLEAASSVGIFSKTKVKEF